MPACVIIPARFGSTRFAAKILAADTGKPLVQHVVEQAKKCSLVREVIVATDDQRIVEALKPYKTSTVMTSPAHPSGTDRIAEAAKGLKDEIIVNVQGDEPEIEPETIDSLIERLQKTSDELATAATPFPADQDPANPNMVKVAISPEGYALYFSRALIPHDRDCDQRPAYHLHLGIYAYRRPFLLEFASWKPTPLEQAEKLEQLRALEHGRRIFVQKVERAINGIDTPQQYEQFVKRYKKEVASC
ncbi:MAG TPA: 3-deoxy-manno-octulosonate cytidylyltransferase [Tepidisphaeraceae bacterium]|nr:3-deoxy-manno-octulosonate cytidylyltransferase [Tepidisphaeraceae bacterium]